jgi:hypothetical protein
MPLRGRCMARPRAGLLRSIPRRDGIKAEEKTTMLLVEQNANVALSIAHFGYIKAVKSYRRRKRWLS